MQSSSAAPVLAPTNELPWSENIILLGFEQTSFSAATFTRPGGSPLALQWLAEDEEWGLPNDVEFGTKAELNAVAPDSASPYVFSLTLAGAGAPSTSSLVIDGDLWSNAPHVTNYDAAQAIDATQDFTLTWAPFTGGTASDIILVFIRGPQVEVFSSPMPGQPGVLTGAATSVTIPAGTLLAGTTYECELLFLKVTDQRTGDIPGANGMSAYETNTSLTIQAASPPPPKFYLLGKSVDYTQTSAGTPVIETETPWSAIVVAIGFEESDFSAVSLARPGLSSVALNFNAEEGMWGLPNDPEFASEVELNAEYPGSGSPYTFSFTPGAGGAATDSPLTLGAAAFPDAPHVTNFAAAQAVDPTLPFTLTWDAFAGGTMDDAILVFVRGAGDNEVFATPFPGADGALDGTATSVQVPAGAFRPGRQYQVEILFLNVVDRRTTDLAGATGYGAYFATTNVSLATTGTADGPANADLLLDFSHTNGTVVEGVAQITFPVTTYYHPVFVAYDDPNPPQSVTITGPAGSQIEGGVVTTSRNSWGDAALAYSPNRLTTGPSSPNPPPSGLYSVAYGSGAPFEFHLTDPESDNRQVVAVPTFTINGNDELTAVGWTLRTPTGAAATVPPAFLDVAVSLFGTSLNLRLEATPDAGSVALSSPIPWSSVQWIDITFQDDLRHFYRSNFNVQQGTAPTIDAGPVTQNVTAAGAVMLSVTASGVPAPTYQWRFDGVDIPGATNSSYTIPNAQQFHAGSYSVLVTNTVDSVLSAPATVTVQEPPSSNSRLTNLSTRALCLTGDNILIPGFVIQGPGNKQLLIRAVGPTLGTSPFNVGGVLPDPRMTLKRYNGTGYDDVTSNDDWGTNANVANIITTSGSLGAFPLVDGSADAVLLVDLAPGQYSVVTDDAGAMSGVAIVELYDVDNAGTTSRLINISNRGYVGAGDSIMIPGYVVSNEGPKTLLIRAVGPTLGGAPFNVPGVLSDPTLTIYKKDFDNNRDDIILFNDDWGASPGAARTAQVASDVSAFALTNGSKDAAFVVTLDPGVYTVHARGTGSLEGIAIVEVYVVP